MLLDELYSDFFAIPHAATGFADKILITASHMVPSLRVKDAILAITVVTAYFRLVYINRVPRPLAMYNTKYEERV